MNNQVDISNNPNKELQGKGLRMADFTSTFKSAYDVYRGQINKVPELWNNGKGLINKASRKIGTTPGVLTAGIVAVGAAFLIYRMNHR